MTANINSKFPQELYMEIFLFYYNSAQNDGLVGEETRLAHVCSAWRKVAIDTRFLWCRVPPLASLHQTEAYLKRSGDHHLHVSMRDSDFDTGAGERVRLLLENSHRWHSFSLWRSQPFGGVTPHPIQTSFTDTHFPCLKSVQVIFGGGPGGPKATNEFYRGAAKGLKDIWLSSILPVERFCDLSLNLREIDLTLTSFTNQKQFVLAFEPLDRLENLILRGVVFINPERLTPTTQLAVTMPRLRTLVVYIHQTLTYQTEIQRIFDLIVARNLRALHIGLSTIPNFQGEIKSPTIPSFSFPKLELLHFFNGFVIKSPSYEGIADDLDKRAPCLQHLAIKNMRSSEWNSIIRALETNSKFLHLNAISIDYKSHGDKCWNPIRTTFRIQEPPEMPPVNDLCGYPLDLKIMQRLVNALPGIEKIELYPCCLLSASDIVPLNNLSDIIKRQTRPRMAFNTLTNGTSYWEPLLREFEYSSLVSLGSPTSGGTPEQVVT